MWHNPRLLNLLAGGLAMAATLALCAGLAYWFMQQPMFVLRVIRIEGDIAHLNLPSVRAVLSQLHNGQRHSHFFNLNLDKARAGFEAMPWVRRVAVRRIWPNQLALTLSEYQALGIWNADWLVSKDGERFAANLAEASESLPALNGPSGREREVVAGYRNFVHGFAPLGFQPVSVTLSERRAWTVQLSNGMRVELGRNEDLPETRENALERRIQRLVMAWKAVTAQWGEAIEYADLRYPNGFAIHPAQAHSGNADVKSKEWIVQ